MTGACPRCGGAAAPWAHARDRTGGPGTAVLRCAACGTGWTDGPGRATPAAPGQAPDGVLGAVALRLARAELRRLLPGLAPGDLVVDVGAGAGLRSAALAALGARVVAVEPDGAEAVRARSHAAGGVHVVTASLQGLPDALTHADAVVCWHVLEHMDDPAAALAAMRGLLRPGGVLVVAVPNAGGADARLLGGRWQGWEPARHRRHFTACTLGREVAEAGLDRVEVRARGGWFPPLGLACSLMPGIDPQTGGNPLAAVAASLLVTPVAAAAAWMGAGPQLVARARRPG
ncbi:MAG: class I SAM-dependent methyltransferase [Thermoleophilia bacterium]